MSTEASNGSQDSQERNESLDGKSVTGPLSEDEFGHIGELGIDVDPARLLPAYLSDLNRVSTNQSDQVVFDYDARQPRIAETESTDLDPGDELRRILEREGANLIIASTVAHILGVSQVRLNDFVSRKDISPVFDVKSENTIVARLYYLPEVEAFKALREREPRRAGRPRKAR